MNKISWFIVALLFFTTSCNQAQQVTNESMNKSEEASKVEKVGEGMELEKVNKTEEEWQAELSEQEFYVLRQKGTERAGTGDLLKNKEQGTYVCAGCSLPLFSSKTKFKSGTGWPSYFQPIKEEYVAEEVDNKYGWNRVEVLCARCDGHLGHVFEDGPPPTGLRYCINSVSLDFVPDEN